MTEEAPAMTTGGLAMTRGSKEGGRWRMNLSRRICGLIIAGCLVALACPGCIEEQFRYKGQKTDTETIDLTGVEAVELKLGSADVEIVSGNVGGGNFIIRKTYRTNDDDYADELLRSAEIKFEKRGSTLYITRPEREKVGIEFFSKGYVSISMTAMIPAGVSLDLVTGSGDFDIDDRTAPVKVRTGSGNVRMATAGAGFEGRSGSGDMRVRTVRGGASISTGSGSIYADDIEGGFRASTGSGDVTVDRVVGSIDISTGSGDVRVGSSDGQATVGTGSGDVRFGDHRGSAEVTTSSGEIDFMTVAEPGEVRLKTASGDVDVVVSNTESVEMDIGTSSGSITSQIPIVVKEATRRRLHGISGGGAWNLHVSTVSGDVTVRTGSI
jgi:DUF4097 and DUF4098 domain-containing protein YvlB